MTFNADKYVNDSNILLSILLSIYILANLIALVITWISNILIVDLMPVDLSLNHTDMIICFVIILFTAIFIKLICTYGSKLALLANHNKHLNCHIGVIVFIIQLLGIIALIKYGFGLASSSYEEFSPNLITRIVSYFSPDAFFLIYYAQFGEHKKPYINIILYIISSILRGWSSFILFILVIELFFLYRKYCFYKATRIAVTILTVILCLLPFIFKAKTIIRGGEVSEEQSMTANAMLLNRLQLFTNVCLIRQEHNELVSYLNSNTILPYYLDNGILYKLARPDTQHISSFIVENYIISHPLVNISWGTHTGIAGWLILLDFIKIPLFIIFILLLIVIPYIFSIYILKDISVLPILHILSVAYVFHGWFSAQINFIISLFIYSCLYNSNFLKKLYLNFNKRCEEKL
jgi:hypothetical protein